MVFPLVPVTRYFMPALDDGMRRRCISLQRYGRGKEGRSNRVALKNSQQPPHADATTVLSNGLHRHIPHALGKRVPPPLAERLVFVVSKGDGLFRALLIV